MRFFSKIVLTISVVLVIPLTGYAGNCPNATSASSPNFCDSFKIAAECHCRASGLRPEMCTNYEMIYKRMMVTFGSLQRACEFQHDISTQECIDDWNCFRLGKTTSQAELCSGTGNACQ